MPTVEIDSEKLDLLWRATFFEELQCSTKKRHVVATVDGEMVGVVMPLWSGLPRATATVDAAAQHRAPQGPHTGDDMTTGYCITEGEEETP